jgi:hypothetical protein
MVASRHSQKRGFYRGFPNGTSQSLINFVGNHGHASQLVYDLLATVYLTYQRREHSEYHLKRSNVAPAHARIAALVPGFAVAGGAMFDSRAARQQGVGLGGAAVVGQGSKQGVCALHITALVQVAINAVLYVVSQRCESRGTIATRVAGQDAIQHLDRAADSGYGAAAGGGVLVERAAKH